MKLAIDTVWFNTQQIAEGLVYFYERHLHPKGSGNIWLIEGSESCLLFDTGTGIGDLSKKVSEITQKPLTAVASTGYYDHAGGLYQFQNRAVHTNEVHRIKSPTPRNTVSDKYLVRDSFSAFPDNHFSPDNYVMTGCHPTQILHDGDYLDIGDRVFEVLHTPGVTTGSIMMYENKTGILFSGESFFDSTPLYDGEPKDETDDADRDTYRSSMQRLLGYEVTTVYPGHGAPIDGIRMRQLIRGYLNR
ncbi:MAG: MBL fold metallo-hydrolase [Acidiferrobacterales bacterium]|nr:MBL fold metallo-hydrolase [Acidiferrobacterales bacterium]